MTAAERFKRSRPCPICGGGDDMPRGTGQRCSGFLSSDGRFAYCTREEHAGYAPLEDTDPVSYRHILEGDCRCGVTHAPARNGSEPSATYYDYTDADGKLVFQVVRLAGKQFRQRRPDGNGGWVWNLQGVERVLYRLPALTTTTGPVYVVEGEKDVHAIEYAGGVATCNPGGAGKWRSEYAQALDGAAVVIVADKDDAGIAHAQQVAQTLPADTTTIVTAAVGKDAHDHLAAGLTLDQFVPLEPNDTLEPETAPDPTVTLAEFVERVPDTDAEPIMTCEQGTVAPAGALILNGGKASAGKTTFVTDLLLHAAAGLDYCGLSFPRPLRILLIENEGPREGFREKLEARLPHGPHGGEPIRIWDDEAIWGMVRVSDAALRTQLRDITQTHRIDLVVSDSLTRFGMTGNGTPEETRDFMALLTDAGLGRSVAFLLLAHTRTRTDNDEDEIEQLAGAWAPHADAIIMLKKLGGNRARLSYPKTRWTRGQVPAAILAFEPDTETFTLVATVDDEADKVTDDTYEDRIREWVAEHPWATTEDLDHGVEGRAIEVRKARARMKEAGHLYSATSAELGRPGKGLRWNLAPTQGFNPVPLPGTGHETEASAPQNDTQPRPTVPTKERDGDAGRGSHTDQGHHAP